MDIQFGANLKWTSFLLKVKESSIATLPYWERYVNFMLILDSRLIISETPDLLQLLKEMETKGLVTEATVLLAKREPLRNFARFAFPFCNCSSLLMNWLIEHKNKLETISKESANSSFAKDGFTRFMNELIVCQFHEGLPTTLTQEHLNMLSNVTETITISELKKRTLMSAVPSVIVKHGDIGIALLKSYNVLCQIFASPKCIAGGTGSTGPAMGGQEEGVFRKNPSLMVIAVCLLGTPLWKGKDIGKIRWNNVFNRALEIGSIVRFQVNKAHNTWAGFQSPSDYREKELDTMEVQQTHADLIFGSLCEEAELTGTTPVLGESGTGIYKGSIIPVARSLSKTMGAVICAWDKEWDKADYSSVPRCSNFSDALSALKPM